MQFYTRTFSLEIKIKIRKTGGLSRDRARDLAIPSLALYQLRCAEAGLEVGWLVLPFAKVDGGVQNTIDRAPLTQPKIVATNPPLFLTRE